MTNQEFLERAAITTADIAAAGKLNPEQADKFVDYVFDESVLKGMVRMERFTNQEKHIDKIGVGRRVAVAKHEAVDPGIRRGVSTSRIVLHPVDVMVPFEIGDKFRQYNIEGDAVEDTIIRMMANQLANDLDELFLGGLTVGPAVIEDDIIDGGSTTSYVKDSYLALFNGFLKAAEGANVVDGENAPADLPLFNKMILAMPNKFRRNRALLRYLASPDHEQGYRAKMAQRGTTAGDEAMQSEKPVTPFGIGLMPVPLLERNPLYAEDSTANTDGTTPTQLAYEPISDLALLPTTIGNNPIPPYVEGAGNDYTEDLTDGAWTRLAGNIGSGQIVRATYRTRGKMLLTNPMNLIIAMNVEDVKLERDRNIYKGMNEFALTVSVDVAIENVDALVMATNIADPTL